MLSGRESSFPALIQALEHILHSTMKPLEHYQTGYNHRSGGLHHQRQRRRIMNMIGMVAKMRMATGTIAVRTLRHTSRPSRGTDSDGLAPKRPRVIGISASRRRRKPKRSTSEPSRCMMRREETSRQKPQGPMGGTPGGNGVRSFPEQTTKTSLYIQQLHTFFTRDFRICRGTLRM